MPGRLLDVGSVTIDNKPYRLVRTDEARAWERTYEDEPPWTGGAPAILSNPTQSWHSGGFRSRAGIQPVSEYGQNTDGRFPYRLLPSAKINTLDLPGCLTTPVSIFEALGQLFVVAGRYVYRVDTADNVVISKDFGTVSAVMGLRWESDFGLVTTSEDAASLWRVLYLTNPDYWEQTADVAAYRLAAGVDRLYRVNKAGFLRNCSTGLNPMVEANWADNIQCGRTDLPPTGLVAYARTVFVGKSEGLFGVDETGYARPLVSRLIQDPDNCFGLAPVDPWVYVPHARGLFRMVPGRVDSVGIEKEVLNESPVRGRVRAVVTDGRWVLVSLWTGTDTYILVGRDSEEADSALGPIVWDTWLCLPGQACDVLHISSLTNPPRLWFGSGLDLSYVKLSTGAGSPDPYGSGYEFAVSGVRYFSRYNFGDWGHKAFPKIAAVGRNLDANTYWTLAYSVDGSAYSSQDADGNEMVVSSNVLTTFVLPATAVGREIQLRATYTGASEASAGELIYLEPFAIPQSRKTAVVAAQLLLSGGALHDQTREQRASLDQMNDLQSLVEQSSPVDVSAPWGTGKSWVRKIRIVEAYQEGDREPELIVAVQLQERETSA